MKFFNVDLDGTDTNILKQSKISEFMHKSKVMQKKVLFPIRAISGKQLPPPLPEVIIDTNKFPTEHECIAANCFDVSSDLDASNEDSTEVHVGSSVSEAICDMMESDITDASKCLVFIFLHCLNINIELPIFVKRNFARNTAPARI